MAVQWPQQYQQNNQYHQPQQFQQSLQHHQSQQYQQPHYQHAQHLPQNGQGAQASPEQYQQPAHQYPQAQQYQHQGQYSQVQQYAQIGQYSQIQSYRQPSQPYFQAQQQAQHSSQHPYVPQEYPSRQYTPQQHLPTQHATYQQQYQQQANPTDAQTYTGVPSSCFNCGAPGHFAQDCPEPKRQVPAGALDPRKYANPLKRAKPGGTVVTKFSPPPQNSQVQLYSRGFSPSTPVQNGHSQYQGIYSPATPSSAHNQAQQQTWEQYYQWQAYQQTQHQHQHSEASYLPQPLYVPANRNATYINGSLQSNQASYKAPHSNSASPPSNTEYTSIPSLQPPVTDAAHASYMQSPAANTLETDTPHQDQQNHAPLLMQFHSITTSLQDDETTLSEPEGDDLDLLDVPDLPKALSLQSETTYLPNTIVAAPAGLISMPLPANFVVADALYPIPPPGPEDNGRCQSKYLRDTTIENICENIKASKYWRDHKDDTVFLARPEDGTTISIDNARADLKQRHSCGETNNDLNRQTRSQSRSVSSRKDSVNVLSKVEKLELEIAEMKAKMREKSSIKGEHFSPTLAATKFSPSDGCTKIKEEPASSPRSATSEMAFKPKKNTEELLAALGVTGSPKPVTVLNGTHNGLQYNSTNHWKADITHQHQDCRGDDQISHSSRSGFPPPPLPPPPSRQLSLPDRKDDSPTSTECGNPDSYALNCDSSDQANGNHTPGLTGEMLSPEEWRSENSRSRKRSHTCRESPSEDEDASARRQEDDVTPKLKRRQPKVAAAYSRRW